MAPVAAAAVAAVAAAAAAAIASRDSLHLSRGNCLSSKLLRASVDKKT